MDIKVTDMIALPAKNPALTAKTIVSKASIIQNLIMYPAWKNASLWSGLLL